MIILWKSRNSYSSSISEITGSEKSEKHVDLLADASELSRYTRGTDQPTLKESSNAFIEALSEIQSSRDALIDEWRLRDAEEEERQRIRQAREEEEQRIRQAEEEERRAFQTREEEERRIRQAEEEERQRILRANAEQAQRERELRGAINSRIRVIVFIAAIAGVIFATFSSLQVAKNMHYHGDFDRWIELGGTKLALSWIAMGAACGINFTKGVDIDYHFPTLVIGYVIYSVIYTMIWINYTSDETAFIAMPIIFFGLGSFVAFVMWISSKMFK